MKLNETGHLKSLKTSQDAAHDIWPKITLASAMSLPPKTVYALLQQVLKDPEIGPGAISEAKKQCPGLLALISQTKKRVAES